MGGWDEALFRWINEGWANPVWDWAMPFITHLAKNPFGIALLAAAWLALLIWGGRKGRRAALLILPAVLIANELADLGKAHLGFLRPCAELRGVRILGEPLTSGGMPSAHAANMAAVAAVLFFQLGRKWWPVWVLPLASGLSRVYIGVHYPLQVIAGWLMGGVIGWLAVRLLGAREPKPSPAAAGRQTEQPEERKDDELSQVS